MHIFVARIYYAMKQKYQLDRENLLFKEVDNSIKAKIKILSIYLVVGGVFSILIWLSLYFGFLPSPKLIVLNSQNQKLITDVGHVNYEFDVISNKLSKLQNRDDNLYRVISQIEPLSETVRKAGFGGTKRDEYLESFFNGELMIESNIKGDILLKQIELQFQSYDTLADFVNNFSDSLLSIPAICPLNPYVFRISSGFGYRIHPVTGKRKIHDGLDFATQIGVPIYATGNGKVIIVNKSNQGYGNRVSIDHGFGFKTTYAHMSKIIVKIEEKVKRGQVIGFVGNTGISTGPHLHYEVIQNNVKKNPKGYYINDLSNDEYNNMIHHFAGLN